MRVRVNRASRLAAGFLVLAALSASADTEETGTQPEPSWAPSLAVTSGFTIQYHEGSASSLIETGPRAGERLQKGDNGQDWAVSPYVGVNAELITPEIPVIPGGIRVFVNGEYLPTFAADLDVAKAGDPKGFDIQDIQFPIAGSLCDAPPVGNGPFGQGCNCPFGFGCFPEEAVTGVGSRVTASVAQNVFGAAVGVAVPFELFGRKLMLKPSVGWIRYEVDVQGVVLRGIKIPLVVPLNPQIRPVPVIRILELRDGATQAFNAIGPGMELEMEVHQVGPIQTSIFLDAHGYRALGNREVKLSDSTTESCPGPVVLPPPPGFTDQGVLGFICTVQFGNAPTDYSADWSFKVDPWLYRVGLGLRFRWTGE